MISSIFKFSTYGQMLKCQIKEMTERQYLTKKSKSNTNVASKQETFLGKATDGKKDKRGMVR